MGPSGPFPPPQKGPEAADCEDTLQAWGKLTAPESLARRLRLGGAEDFRRVLGRGKRQRLGSLDLWWVPNEVGHPRLGLVVPKFQSTAVARNRLRRRLKEVARRVVLPRLEPVDLVIRIRREAYGATAGQLAKDVDQWLETRAPLRV